MNYDGIIDMTEVQCPRGHCALEEGEISYQLLFWMMTRVLLTKLANYHAGSIVKKSKVSDSLIKLEYSILDEKALCGLQSKT